MTSILALNNRYAGLFYTAKQIGHHFIKSKYYIECFSGLARTAKYSRSEIMVLNDISQFANKKCRKLFPNAIITNMDFIECIKKYNFEDSFFLIDPPWRLDHYDTNSETSLERWKNADKKTRGDLSLIETSRLNRDTAVEYIEALEKILPTIKGTYIVTLGGMWLKKKIKSPYSKLVIHTHSRIFGYKPKTLMFSNKPLEIQIPQIIDYV